jgi:hypothetical protein
MNNVEERTIHWESVLMATPLPGELVTYVATILVQDENWGFDARTRQQQAIMARAAQSVSLAGVSR